MSRMEIFSGSERRRRWSVEEKRRLVAAAFSPGAVVSEVARRADIHPNQLYRWRQDLCFLPTRFAEVVVAAPVEEQPIETSAMIEVVLTDWARCRIPVSVSADVAAAVVGALVRR
jgi:transposase